MLFNQLDAKSVTYKRQSTPCLLQYANNNRDNERFNDVTVVSGDTSIRVNRMVLSCYCSFFDRIFASQACKHFHDSCNDYSDVASQTNNQDNDSVIEIPNVDGNSLKFIVKFIYTGQINIDSDNVISILAAAHHLELDEVMQFCFEFFENCITPDNCITILITAKQYKNFNLRDKAYKHISENYEEISQTPAFLNLENVELFFIVYHLKTKFGVNDAVLCRSLLSWTKIDEETRIEHFDRISKFVNVEQLSYWEGKKLIKEDLVQKNSELFSALKNRMDHLKLKGTRILSIGGYYSKTSVRVVYSISDDGSSLYPDIPIPLLYHRTLNINGALYCIGGRSDNVDWSNKVFKLDLKEQNRTWKEMTPMLTKRQAPGAAVFDKALVVCGGYGNESYLSSTESYDPSCDSWSQISLLKNCRRGNEALVSGGFLYSLGGWDERVCLSSVERLDGLDQPWKFATSMQTPRFVFATAECDGHIYAIGGMNNDLKVLKSVEKYDCCADEWSYVSEMNIERRAHSACVMQGRVFVLGGWNDEYKPITAVECYDPQKDVWEVVDNLEYKLCGNSLIVV